MLHLHKDYTGISSAPRTSQILSNVKFTLLLGTFSSFFSSEFTNVIIVTSDGITPVNAVLKLLRHCTKSVIDCHSSDNPPVARFIMEGTYNPPKLGTAYYFRSHGCQVRKVRKFPIDTDRSSQNFDEAPDFLCTKRLPEVSKQDTSYLFLWFWPQHGHCYGCHIIPA